MLGFGAVRHDLEVVNAVFIIRAKSSSKTQRSMFVFSLDNRNIPMYTVYLFDFMRCPMSSMDLFCHIFFSLKRVCLNLTNQVSKTLTFPTPPTNGNEGPGNAPREKIPNELPVPMPSLEPPEKDGDDVMDQDLHVDDPKWKGYYHGGNFTKKPFRLVNEL